MKAKMFAVVFVMFVVAILSVSGQQAQQQQVVKTWQEVISSCPTIAVAEVQSDDLGGRNNYVSNASMEQRIAQREALRGRAYGYGGFGGYGYPGSRSGVHNTRSYPIYTLDPAGKLPTVIQGMIEQELGGLGANVLAPATGPNSTALDTMRAEAAVGRNAGNYEKTWETAACVVAARVSILGETVNSGGFDGTGPGFTLRTVSWRIGNRTARSVLDIIGASVSQVQKHKEERIVTATLRVQVFDLRSRRAVYTTSGTDTVKDGEFAYFNIVGVYKSIDKFPNPELLGRAIVAQAFGKTVQ